MGLMMDEHKRLGTTLQCPDCEYEAKSIYEWLDRLDRFIEQTNNRVILYSKCPVCSSVSWAHFSVEQVNAYKPTVFRYQKYLLRVGADRIIVIQEDSSWADKVVDSLKLIKIVSRYREPVGKNLNDAKYPASVRDVTGVVIIGGRWIVESINVSQFRGQMVFTIPPFDVADRVIKLEVAVSS